MKAVPANEGSTRTCGVVEELTAGLKSCGTLTKKIEATPDNVGAS